MTAEFALFLAAGIVGGAVNAIAGGAKLFVFPMLLASGLPPVTANATGTVALWPAQLPTLWVYRDRLRMSRWELGILMLPALAGALSGAGALIFSGERVFLALVPFFLGVAVAAIAFGDRAVALARRTAPERRAGIGSGVLLFGCGFYAGFFGAGLGFMLLAALTLAGFSNVHDANARKNLFALAANTTAVIPLALSGLVDWLAASAVLAGGLVGGYAGARMIKNVPQRPLRIAVAIIGVLLTISFLAN